MARSSVAALLLSLAALVAGCDPEEREFRPQRAAPVASSSGGASEPLPQDAGVIGEEENPREAIERGRARFAQYCAPCHARNGQGLVGPNLTDGLSIHEALSAGDYRGIIENGVPDRGMPAWRPILQEGGVDDVLLYVWSLRHTNVAGRAAQGTYQLPR